jgi:hypothetical protein
MLTDPYFALEIADEIEDLPSICQDMLTDPYFALRLELAGAVYHLLNRSDLQEARSRAS